MWGVGHGFKRQVGPFRRKPAQNRLPCPSFAEPLPPSRAQTPRLTTHTQPPTSTAQRYNWPQKSHCNNYRTQCTATATKPCYYRLQSSHAWTLLQQTSERKLSTPTCSGRHERTPGVPQPLHYLQQQTKPSRHASISLTSRPPGELCCHKTHSTKHPTINVGAMTINSMLQPSS